MTRFEKKLFIDLNLRLIPGFPLENCMKPEGIHRTICIDTRWLLFFSRKYLILQVNSSSVNRFITVLTLTHARTLILLVNTYFSVIYRTVGTWQS